MRIALSFICLVMLIACAPQLPDMGARTTTPSFDGEEWISADGTRLPLRVWSESETPKAIVIGVHGFNDYGNFVTPGFAEFLTGKGVDVLTYDQRGFGAAPYRGRWVGEDILTTDLKDFITLVQSENPDVPLYVLGESMGGAMVISTFDRYADLAVDGVILVAPALWGPSTWPFYQRWALTFFAKTMPGLKLSGGGIVQPTDNVRLWENWSRDPLVIRGTRFEAIYGVSKLMEDALDAIERLEAETLMLYGAHDEIIPPVAIQSALPKLDEQVRLGFYDTGWHMLTRDENAALVWRDIWAWIDERRLVSGADQGAFQKITALND